LLPLDWATAIAARLFGVFVPLLNPKRQRLALENLKVAFPSKSEAERAAICRAHWENLGRVIIETLEIDRIINDPARIEIVGLRVLMRYRDKLGAAIGVTLHMGNWELAICPLLVAGANPAALYRALDNPYVDRFLQRQRAKLYPGGMFGRGGMDGSRGDDHEAVRAMTDYVRCGGRLGIVCDQYYRRGVPVRFFGRVTRAQPIAALIARRMGVRIWMARCLRVGTQSRFKIEFRELRVPRTRNQAEDVRTILSEMLGQFEEWIRDAPEQWLWGTRKWN
jgi:KDO2-lipid IV(A) lauroyltransferase